ncbi:MULTISPECIES: hypothetical protein [Salinibaculum]|uniref:hypothetical protein n=1 Tax=Salinibaculum TaxID=2732368 RepID=UPI0030CC229F
MSALNHVVRLARIDVTRMLRKHTDRSESAGRVISTVVFGLVLVVATLASAYGASRLGASLVAGELSDVAANGIVAARGLVAVFGVIGSVVVIVRAIGQRGTLTNAEGVLTIVPTRQALLGLLLAEYVYVLLWLGGPALGIGVGLAVGTGTVWPALTVPLGVAAVAVPIVAIGYPLGLGLRHFVTRFAFVARNKGRLIVLVFAVYFALVATGSLNAAVVRLFEPLQASPTGWFADLLFLGTPTLSATPVRAVGAVGVALALGLAGTVAGTRVAEAHWFSDPALAGEPEPETPAEAAEPGLERRLAPVLGVPTAALVVLAWRRAIRAPMKLLYAAYPLFFAVGIVADILQTGEVPPYLPVGTLVFVTWAAGVIFTLNPLGDQGAGLPSTLLSRVDGRRFVHAHLLASLIVAVPLGLALTAAAALVSPVDTETTLALVVATPVLMAVASALSVGIGIAFPRFEAVNITRSMETVIPSLLAFALFTVHLVGTTAALAVVYDEGVRATAAFLVSWLLPFGLTVGAETLFLVAAALLAGLVAAPLVSYRYAVRRFDTYTLG